MAIPVTAAMPQWVRSTGVRRAIHADIPALLRMGRAFFEESGFEAESSYDEASVTATLTHLLDGGGAVFIAEKNGRAVGIAAALAYPFYFNTNCRAGQELFWWLDPAHRGGVLGVRMLKAMEKWARDEGCHTFMMISLPSLTESPAAKLYARMGYRPSECNFIKRMN